MSWIGRTALVLAVLGAALVPGAPQVAACSRSAPCVPSQLGGSLSITVPAGPVMLGSATISSVTATITGQLGVVTVNETGLLGGGWTAYVSGSDFKTGGGSSFETIQIGKIQYWSGPTTAHSGLSSSTPGQMTSSQKITLTGSPQMAFAGSGALLGNSTSWNPTLIVTVAPSAIAGTYSGTITHTVS